MCPASWSHDILPLIILMLMFLIDYVCHTVCNIWVLLFKNNSTNCHCTGASEKKTRKRKIGVVITQDRVIDDNLKRQIKN